MYVHTLKNNSSLPQSCVAATLPSRAINSIDGRVEERCASSDRARSWRRNHTTETGRECPHHGVATLDVRAHGAGVCGGVVAIRVGAFEGFLSSVEPRVPAEVAEVRRLVGTAWELADRGGLTSVVPVVTGDGAGIGTRVAALPALVRPLESVVVPHVTLKVP